MRESLIDLYVRSLRFMTLWLTKTSWLTSDEGMMVHRSAVACMA